MPSMRMRTEAELDASDARRIAACLRACAGIPTDRLEEGALIRLVAACIHVDDPEVRSAVDDLIAREPGSAMAVPVRRRAVQAR